jgi:hypothetical protein
MTVPRSLGALLLGALALASCRTDRARLVPHPDAGMACELPLASHCDKGKCRSYAETLAVLHDPQSPYTAPFGHIEAGECNAGHYTQSTVWYMHVTEYFDAAGTMIGAQETTDAAQFCDGRSFSASFGTVPSCARRRTELIVDHDGG